MKIAFLGDSITLGWGLEDKSCRYATLVAEALGMEEENYGITGTLMARAGMNRSDGRDFLTRASLIDGADIAVVFGGTNDYFWSDTPIAGGDDPSYFSVAVDALCRHVKETREGKTALFVSPYPHNGIGNFFGGKDEKDSSRHDTSEKNLVGHVLRDYVAVLEEACAKYEIPFLNLHRDFPFDHEKHTMDGCHPNDLGMYRMASVIGPVVAKALGIEDDVKHDYEVYR